MLRRFVGLSLFLILGFGAGAVQAYETGQQLQGEVQAVDASREPMAFLQATDEHVFASESCQGFLQAVAMRHHKTVLNMLRAGCSPDVTDAHGNTALHLSVISTSTSGQCHANYTACTKDLVHRPPSVFLTQLFILSQEDASARNEKGLTPLLTAVVNLNKTHHSKDIGIGKDGAENDAETQAIAGAEAQYELQHHGNSKHHRDRKAQQRKKARLLKTWVILKLLVKKAKVDINAVDNDGNTALILAANSKRALGLGYLLKLGAKTGLKNKAGLTALDLAKESGNKRAVRILKAWAKRKKRAKTPTQSLGFKSDVCRACP